MGLLEQFKAQDTEVDVAPAPVPTAVKEVPAPVSTAVDKAPAPAADLVLKRDPHGFIDSATGYNAQGQKVTFDFTRDGKKNLERIKVR